MTENIVNQIPQIHEIQAVEQQVEPIVVEEAQAEPQPIEFPAGQY
jgi:hypothetical protein